MWILPLGTGSIVPPRLPAITVFTTFPPSSWLYNLFSGTISDQLKSSLQGQVGCQLWGSFPGQRSKSGNETTINVALPHWKLAESITSLIPFLSPLPTLQLMWFAWPLLGWDLPFCQLLGHSAAIMSRICVLWWGTCWRCHGWPQGIRGEVHDPNVQGVLVKKLLYPPS